MQVAVAVLVILVVAVAVAVAAAPLSKTYLLSSFSAAPQQPLNPSAAPQLSFACKTLAGDSAELLSAYSSLCWHALPVPMLNQVIGFGAPYYHNIRFSGPNDYGVKVFTGPTIPTSKIWGGTILMTLGPFRGPRLLDRKSVV